MKSSFASLPDKEAARKLVFSTGKKKSVFLLPSREALDADYGINVSATITPSTNLVCAESEKQIFKDMEKSLSLIVPNTYKKPKLYCRPFEELQLLDRFDLSWHDLCGNLSLSQVHSLIKFSANNLLPGAEACFTFTTRKRGNHFMNDFVDFVSSTGIFEQPKLKYLNASQPVVLAQVVLLKYIFGKFNLKVFTYGHHEDVAKKSCGVKSDYMILYRLTDISKGNVLNHAERIMIETFLLSYGVFGKMDMNLAKLIEKFPMAVKNYDKLRGFKRSLTLYCQNKEKETGTPAWRFKAALKMQLSKLGYDSSCL